MLLIAITCHGRLLCCPGKGQLVEAMKGDPGAPVHGVLDKAGDRAMSQEYVCISLQRAGEYSGWSLIGRAGCGAGNLVRGGEGIGVAFSNFAFTLVYIARGTSCVEMRPCMFSLRGCRLLRCGNINSVVSCEIWGMY